MALLEPPPELPSPPPLPHRPSLIVNADDFGRSSDINLAVIRAHREGILTSASLMVQGQAVEQAVALARENPTLGVGLHLTLVDGASILPPASLPEWTNASGRFPQQPAGAAWRLFWSRRLREPLRKEIAAQMERFLGFNLPLDHLNGHLHFHLHPVVLRLWTSMAQEWGLTRTRLTRDLFGMQAGWSSGRWRYRISHALIFGALARYARPILRQHGLRHTRAVFGLLQSGHVTEDYLVRLLSALPPGDFELYSHPSLTHGKAEFEALISPRARACVQRRGIRLIRYQDL